MPRKAPLRIVGEFVDCECKLTAAEFYHMRPKVWQTHSTVFVCVFWRTIFFFWRLFDLNEVELLCGTGRPN